jgi:hypothetical protein
MSVVKSSSQVFRSTFPCRSSASNSDAAAPASLSAAIVRAGRRATTSRSINSSKARKVAASTVGPAAQFELSLRRGMKSCSVMLRR